MIIQNDLKQLVSQSVKLLGEALGEIHGTFLYQEIENLRVKMKGVRGQEASVVNQALEDVYRDLKKSNSEKLHSIAKAFSLMLELINTCEAAYRSYRLKEYRISAQKKPDNIIYVFTGHPTESRSHGFLKLMNEVEKIFIEALSSDFESVHERLFYLLKIAVRLNLANNRRPQVRDEMDQVFHVVLDQQILQEQVRLYRKGISVSFRTWVGGDKDGNPKVGSPTMLESWALSRHGLIDFINSILKEFSEELELIEEGSKVKIEFLKFKESLRMLKNIEAGDGKKIVQLKKDLKKLQAVASTNNLLAPVLKDIDALIYLYPALVLPLEIREDSELINLAVTDPKQPIFQMLTTLAQISKGLDPKWYVRGFVISMCQTADDIMAAVTITKRALKELLIPIVPLFENEKGLTDSIKILEGAFKSYPFYKIHKERWGSRFEVMLGYSDSSKENGVLPARLMIEKTLFSLEVFLQKKKFIPVFFHGSGGSTSRGGGTVQEQISWWPQSALNIFKVTIQGEMVQRNFSNPLIMRSQVGKVVEGYSKVSPKAPKQSKGLISFSSRIQTSYRSLVSDSSFQMLTSKATPYDYLNLLKIGSRPTKRNKSGKFSLRAIPWILCWTQTRLLLPVWWGTGVAWAALTKEEKESVKQDYKKSPLLQSYVKNLGFTLAKVELGVWNFHLDHSGLSSVEKSKWKKAITNEFDLSIKFFHEISEEKNYTWFRPWLGESIYFRSSMIHPLNVIQKLALERKDHVLLRETVTGIACGMLTTG